MTEFFPLSCVILAYLLANLLMQPPVCHLDAGWHAYWGRFRHLGVRLQQTHNVLMGCCRLGNALIHAFLSKLAPESDPERISRILFLILNVPAIVGFYFIVGGGTIGVACAATYAFLTSNPFIGAQYDSSERFQMIIDIGLFGLLLTAVSNPQSYYPGVLVFGMIASALMFKFTALGVQFMLWVGMMGEVMRQSGYGSEAALSSLVSSIIGGGLAAGGFILLIWQIGLLRRENLGLLGYLSNNRSSRQYSDERMNEAAARRLAEWSDDQLRTKVLKILMRLRLLSWLGFIMEARDALKNLKTRSTHYGAQIFLSARAVLLLATVGVLNGGQGTNFHYYALLWIAGALLVLILQARFLIFHFIPLILPISILAGLGASHLVEALYARDPFSYGVVVMIFGVAALDLKFMISRLVLWRSMPRELRSWPEFSHQMMEKNLAVSEIVPFIKSVTNEKAYILAWGAVPQIYALSLRRCPVNWANTVDRLMDNIFPSWRSVLFERMRETRPVLLLRFDDDMDLSQIEQETGLKYKHIKKFYHDKFDVYELQ